LNEHPYKEQCALSHLGIQVLTIEDVLEIKRYWEENGLLTEDEMQTNCCFALQDKTWVSDPDGNKWEVFVVLEDNLPETNMCCANNEIDSEKAVEVTDVGCCASISIPSNVSKEVQKNCY
jgi:hypothetical protein